MISVGANRIELADIHIGDCLCLEVCIKCIDYSLPSGIANGELPHGADLVVLDGDCVADCLDEVAATATVELSALSVDFVCSCGEAVKVQVPEFILVDFNFEQSICVLYHVGKVLLKQLFKFKKFHVVLPFLLFIFNYSSS
jgi:hypothetical protein